MEDHKEQQTTETEKFEPIFSGEYDADFACLLFQLFRNGATPAEKTELLDALINQLAPLVNTVSATMYTPDLGSHNINVFMLEALEHVYMSLVSETKYIPEHVEQNSKSFTRYFWSMIRFSMDDSYRRNYSPRVFDYVGKGYEEPLSGRLKNHGDSEIKLYTDQFYKKVLKIAVNDVRFVGKEKKACILIGKCLLGLKDMHPQAVRFKYGIAKERTMFLVQYMEHLLRVATKELRRVDESIGT